MDLRGMRRADFQTLLARLLRVARLDATAFLDVRNDPTATLPAAVVVIAASLLSGVGGWLAYVARFPAPRDDGRFLLHSVIIGSLAAIVLWGAWVGVTFIVLRQGYRREVDLRSLVRTMGLAFFPVGFALLMPLPALGFSIGLIALAAAFMLSSVAVEASTEAEPAEVLLSNLAGFAVFAILLGLLGRDGNFYAPGLFAFNPL